MTQDYYTIPSYCEAFDLDRDYNTRVLHRPLIEYILFLGSYRQAVFILRHLQGVGGRKPPRRKFRPWCRHSCKDSDGASIWDDLTLTNQEYHALLSGLIQANRNDRVQLWEVVSSQKAKGHPTHWYYLRLAIFYANSRAVEELLERGWTINDSIWVYPWTLLGEACWMASDADMGVFPAYQKLWKMNQQVHDTRYYCSRRWLDEAVALRKKDAETNVATLREHHAFPSISNGSLMLSLIIFGYLAIYLGALPAILYTRHVLPHLSDLSRLGWVYAYSLLAMLFPPPPLIFGVHWLWNQPGKRRLKSAIRYRILPAICLVNHVGLLMALIRGNTTALGFFWGIYLMPSVGAGALIGSMSGNHKRLLRAMRCSAEKIKR